MAVYTETLWNEHDVENKRKLAREKMEGRQLEAPLVPILYNGAAQRST
jgi:hypothetical protein